MKRRHKAINPNRLIDNIFHPLFKENKTFVLIDGAMHFIVEQNPPVSMKKFIRYSLKLYYDTKIQEGYYMSENTKIYDEIERKRAAQKKEEGQQLKNQIKADATNRALGIRKRNQSSLFDSLEIK